MVLFPSDIVTTINRPLDAKSNVLTIAERNAIPVTHRYKGMVVVVQNTGEERPGIYWLPTHDLTNTGWEAIEASGLPQAQLDALRNAILKEVDLRLEKHSCGEDRIIVKIL